MKTKFGIHVLVVLILFGSFVVWYNSTEFKQEPPQFDDDYAMTANKPSYETDESKFNTEIVGDKSRGDFIGQFDTSKLRKYNTTTQNKITDFTIDQKCEKLYCPHKCGA